MSLCLSKSWPNGSGNGSSSPASRRLTKEAKASYFSRSYEKERIMADEVAVLAGGCFWCTETVFNDVVGVKSVESGYIGGDLINPTYKQVCGGDTGHAEAIRVTFDPEAISYDDLHDIFFATHDPTQLNRQGNDIGSQYRSAIFPQNEEQEQRARAGVERA